MLYSWCALNSYNLDGFTMLKALKSLFASGRDLKPDEYTVVTYHEGQEYVSHDGLGLKAEQRPPEPELEPEEILEVACAADDGMVDSITLARLLGVACAADDFGADDFGPGFGSLLSDQNDDLSGFGSGADYLFSDDQMEVNPATGLFMMDGSIDTGGNHYGSSSDDM